MDTYSSRHLGDVYGGGSGKKKHKEMALHHDASDSCGCGSGAKKSECCKSEQQHVAPKKKEGASKEPWWVKLWWM